MTGVSLSRKVEQKSHLGRPGSLQQRLDGSSIRRRRPHRDLGPRLSIVAGGVGLGRLAVGRRILLVASTAPPRAMPLLAAPAAACAALVGRGRRRGSGWGRGRGGVWQQQGSHGSEPPGLGGQRGRVAVKPTLQQALQEGLGGGNRFGRAGTAQRLRNM